ncbi:hypothetical protein DR62_06090 [Burkholderia thailandensis]|nr:hypothetical protein DR62_06090 [Burkholderia thailandensis]AOI50350.1 hypothetical protein WI24_00065 [Burkholderia thailandensis]AOJ49390.1 hypothetical protein AQ475_00065 [Burkholderia thailandensis]AVR24753.1 hypothetical protein A8H32_06080 [Burkholderia thailandensis]MDD1480945.1 hypothetical protein [Burkholderia thailandensis]
MPAPVRFDAFGSARCRVAPRGRGDRGPAMSGSVTSPVPLRHGMTQRGAMRRVVTQRMRHGTT